MQGAQKTILSADDEAAREVEGRILQVAARFEGELRERVTRLLLTAAEAILKLADLDLVRHESNEEQGGHTLALWEELAPVMGSTVQHVNELIEGASEQFPPPPESDLEDDLENAFGPSGAALQGGAPAKSQARPSAEDGESTEKQI